jgi:hypothetical protein
LAARARLTIHRELGVPFAGGKTDVIFVKQIPAFGGLSSRRVSVTIRMAGQQPVDTHSKFFLNANQDIGWRRNNPPFIFRELTLTDAELPGEFLLRDVESSQFPDPSPEGLHIGRSVFFAAQFST